MPLDLPQPLDYTTTATPGLATPGNIGHGANVAGFGSVDWSGYPADPTQASLGYTPPSDPMTTATPAGMSQGGNPQYEPYVPNPQPPPAVYQPVDEQGLGGVLDMSQAQNPFSYNLASSYSGPSISGGYTLPTANASYSGLGAEYQDQLTGFLGDLQGLVPYYGQSIVNAMSLPGQIDDWTQDLVSQYRTSGLDAIDVFGQVGNQMASRGVTGGTTADYTRGMMLDQLADRVGQAQAAALTNAINQKVGAIMGVPAMAQAPLGLFPTALGLGQYSESASYGGGGEQFSYTAPSISQGVSYEEDPTVWAGLVLDLIGSGYIEGE